MTSPIMTARSTTRFPAILRTSAWLGALLLLVPALAGAEAFDPKATEDVGVVELITMDKDGGARKTKVWIVLVEGEAYLRTNESRWLKNLRRIPMATLRFSEKDYPVIAEILTDPSWVEKVDQASREKYGWQEKTIHVFRMSEPTIIRLQPSRQPGVIRDSVD